MSFSQKLSSALSLLLLAGMFLPFAASAETPKGTVIINVLDENGELFSGDWYLHMGGINGLVKRNGSASETFSADAGSYFLEVRSLPGDHPYSWLFSENPQLVEEGATVTFTAQYFETEEAMLTASGNPPDLPEQAPEQEVSPSQIYDENGCNATLGYTYCEATAACVKFWSPSCKVEAKEEPIDEIEESSAPDPEPTPVVITNPASFIQVPSFEMAPPSTETSESEPDETFILPVQLAQTGAGAALPMALSMLAAWGLVRRKR